MDSSVAFCVLDRRTSPRRRRDELARLGATAVRDVDGHTDLADGTPVDDEIGLVMLTSGSSGEPKAVELTWSALRASAELTQSTLRGDTAPVWFPCLPACHIGGLAVILRAVLSDATLLWGDREDLEGASARGATHVSVVRTQLARHDVSGFHSVLLGGASATGRSAGERHRDLGNDRDRVGRRLRRRGVAGRGGRERRRRDLCSHADALPLVSRRPEATRDRTRRSRRLVPDRRRRRGRRRARVGTRVVSDSSSTRAARSSGPKSSSRPSPQSNECATSR